MPGDGSTLLAAAIHEARALSLPLAHHVAQPLFLWRQRPGEQVVPDYHTAHADEQDADEQAHPAAIAAPGGPYHLRPDRLPATVDGDADTNQREIR
jgi:hypothetical protein